MDRREDEPRPIRILAISGSLRAGSSNTMLLRAAAELVPEGVEVILFGGIGDLPHFNPDREEIDADLPAVREYRAQLNASDALLISSPEYAHGVPGVLKNALDWIVGSGELVGKAVALINASPRSTYAQASLTETLTVMTADLVAEASITLPILGRKLDTAGIVADPELSAALRSAIAALTRVARNRTTSSD
jgi:chromate reductase, NAD(P)H dehydrogenase (quinone)